MAILSTIAAMFEQLMNQPACVLVVIGLNIIAFAIEQLPWINSRWALPVCILLGPLAYPWFADRSTVPYTFPYPVAVLVVNGLMSGLIAGVIHTKFVLGIKHWLGRAKPAATH